MGNLFINAAEIQRIRLTSVSSAGVNVSLSPTYANVNLYKVSVPRAEDASGNLVSVRVLKYPTYITLLPDLNAAFIECDVMPLS
jgi:hypothetical protein